MKNESYYADLEVEKVVQYSSESYKQERPSQSYLCFEEELGRSSPELWSEKLTGLVQFERTNRVILILPYYLVK